MAYEPDSGLLNMSSPRFTCQSRRTDLREFNRFFTMESCLFALRFIPRCKHTADILFSDVGCGKPAA